LTKNENPAGKLELKVHHLTFNYIKTIKDLQLKEDLAGASEKKE